MNDTPVHSKKEDSNGSPLWARYYDLERCEPFVCDRDGVPRLARRQRDVSRLALRGGIGLVPRVWSLKS